MCAMWVSFVQRMFYTYSKPYGGWYKNFHIQLMYRWNIKNENGLSDFVFFF
jgi:hypothetical protein